MKIFLVRHAHVGYETELGAKYKAPVYGEHLSPLGWSQSLELDYLLVKSDIQFDALYSSDYCRAIETITPFSTRNKQKVMEFSELREVEINLGTESFSQASARIKTILIKLSQNHNQNSTILVTTHGILIESFFQTTFGELKNRVLWPDVYSFDLIDGVFSNLHREAYLIPKNQSDHSKLNYYPELS